MGSRPLAAVAVACLAVLAGCGAFVGGSPGGVETVTPVPLTDREPTATAPAGEPSRGSLPPGVGADGSVNVTRLVAAHEAYVADRSYRWTFRYAVGHRTASLSDPDYVRRVVVGGDAFLVDETAGQAANESLFVADGEGYLREARENATAVSRVARPRDHRSYAFAGDMIRRFLTNVTFAVTVVERGGQTYYRLHTTGTGVPRPLRRFGRAVWNYTATAYVTPAGFVRTLVVEYDHLGTNELNHVRGRYDYAAVGTTTVDRPDWVSEVTPVPTPSPTAAPVGTTHNSTATTALRGGTGSTPAINPAASSGSVAAD